MPQGRASREGKSQTPDAPSPSARRVQRHGPTHELIGESPGADALRKSIRALAATRATALVTGETGTGKGLVARMIHRLSGDARFVHVDCASLAPSVIESELFGHERGAFTGASERRIGRFEWAAAGTVFLDEVAEIDGPLQAKLLRVLQDRRFERVGGNETLALQARVIAATNRDLASQIAAGRFRADLYYRLQVVELHVPPLRERAGDVALLFRAATERAYRARGLPRPAVDSELLLRLGRHPWPGNVREVFNLVERLAVARPAGPWRLQDVEPVLARSARTGTLPGAECNPDSRVHFDARERALLTRVLEQHRWNVSATARALGLSRGALRGRMARLGVE